MTSRDGPGFRGRRRMSMPERVWLLARACARAGARRTFGL
jgi:hypothetical protein